MLTRSGVAKRLGKSLATIRRMEGAELHATVDGRGVHWFAESDVEEVAMRIAQGDTFCAATDDDAPWLDTYEVEQLKAQVRSLKSQIATMQQQVVAEQQSCHDLRRANREAWAAAAELAQFVTDSDLADDLGYAARRRLEEIASNSR